jgi:multiple sugar transport system substrate-binding protein
LTCRSSASPAGPPASSGATWQPRSSSLTRWRSTATTPTSPFEEAPFESLFQKAATSLQAGSAQYNIIISGSQWLGALAEPGSIVQLSDIIAANPELNIPFEEAAQIAYRTYPDGTDQLWGFPEEADTQALFVRQDLFTDPAEREAYQAANNGEDLPQTFEDWELVDLDRFERIAGFFTRPDQNLYGTALQWSKVYNFIACYSYPFMFSNGGEVWDPTNGQVEGILDSQVNADSLARCKSFLQYAPQGATNFSIAEEVDSFTAGTSPPASSGRPSVHRCSTRRSVARPARSTTPPSRSPRTWC